MRTTSLHFSLICLALFNFINVSFSQVEVQLKYEDGKPNDHCMVFIDSVEYGLSNRYGYVLFNDEHSGKQVIVEDLESDFSCTFALSHDTTIITKAITEFDEVEIKPRNKKKFVESVLEVNRERLPQQLQLKGEVFTIDYYVFNDDSDATLDTMIEIFTCDIVFHDLLGDVSIYYDHPVKLRAGDFNLFDKKGQYAIGKRLMTPVESFESMVKNTINFKRVEVKKYRKYESKLLSDDDVWSAQFFKSDSSKFSFNSVGKEFKYTWRKSDSTLTGLSNYLKLGNESSSAFCVPFQSLEFSRKNENYEHAHILQEFELILSDNNQSRIMKNNFFSYFFIDSASSQGIPLSEYEKADSFEALVNDTQPKKSIENIHLKLYPLRLPVGILFRHFF